MVGTMRGKPAEHVPERGASGGNAVPDLGTDMRLGDLMRGERATLGKSLLDVQRELRIRASYIAAIENCDVSAFDSPSFIAGYVRSYARYLRLDPELTFRRFCTESGHAPMHGMRDEASGPKPQRRPADVAEALANPQPLFLPQPESAWAQIDARAIGSILVLALLISGLGYGGYAILQEVQRVQVITGDASPGVIATLDPAGDALFGEGEEVDLALNVPQPEALDRAYRPNTLEMPVLVARDGPISAIDPYIAGGGLAEESPEQRVAASITPALVQSTSAQAMLTGPQLPETQLAVRTTAPNAPDVELLAVRPAWVRVTGADGTIILEKTLNAGERFAMPQLEQPPVLRAGNSGALYFVVNGRTYGPAAPGPQVVKNVELSPTALTAQYAYADLTQDADLAALVSVAQIDPELANPALTSGPGSANQ